MAARSAEGIMKEMRNTGALTTNATKGVLKLTSAFQTLGFSETGNKFMQQIATGQAYAGVDGSLDSLVSIMAGNNELLLDELRAGRMPSAKMRLESGQNVENQLIDYVRQGLKDSGQLESIESKIGKIEAANLDQALEMMEPALAAVLNNNVKHMFNGMGIKETAGFAQAQKMSGRTYEDKMKEINEEIAALKAQGIDPNGALIAGLEKQKRSEQIDMGMSGFEALNQELKKKGQTYDQALTAAQEKIAKEGGEAAGKEFGDPNKVFRTMMDSLATEAKVGGKDLQKLLSGQGINENQLRSMLMSSNEKDRDRGKSVLDAIKNEIDTKQKMASDPITEWRHWMDESNAALKDFAQNVRAAMGPKEAAAAVGGGWAASAISRIIGLLPAVGGAVQLWGAGKSMLGFGKAAGAAGAGAGAGAGVARAARKTN